MRTLDVLLAGPTSVAGATTSALLLEKLLTVHAAGTATGARTKISEYVHRSGLSAMALVTDTLADSAASVGARR